MPTIAEWRGMKETRALLHGDVLYGKPLEETLKVIADEAAVSAQRKSQLPSVALGIHSESRPLSASVKSTHPASGYIEVGRKPGSFPPTGALRFWASKRNIPADSVFPIARAIARRGIRGRFFMRAAEGNAKRNWNKYLRSLDAGIRAKWGKR